METCAFCNFVTLEMVDRRPLQAAFCKLQVVDRKAYL